MKNLINQVLILFIGLTVISCSDEDENFDYLNNAPAPQNITATVQLSADNSGLVVVTPAAQGAKFFNLYFDETAAEPVVVPLGDSAEYTYSEGSYDLRIEGVGVNGKITEVIEKIVVSFNPPTDLEITVQNDPAVAKQVKVTATANEANTFEVYFGEEGNDTPITIGLEEEAIYKYKEEGTYTVRVVAKGGAIATIETTQEITVSSILQPISAAPVPPARDANNVISLFSDSYTDVVVDTWRTSWSQVENFEDIEIEGNAVKKYSGLQFVGVETIVNQVDASSMAYVHIDFWTPNMDVVKFKLVDAGSDGIIGSPAGDDSEQEETFDDIQLGQWNSIDIKLDDLTALKTRSNLSQYIFSGTSDGVLYIDNVYFYNPISLVGTWLMAPEAFAFRVGTGKNGTDYGNPDSDITDRACYFNDEYVFESNGSFKNVLGIDTFLEDWQNAADPFKCGTPVAPHDGPAGLTYKYDLEKGTINIVGKGGYIGLPKAYFGGEFSNDNLPISDNVPESILYEANFLDNNTLKVHIFIGNDDDGNAKYWSYKLIRKL